MLPPVLAMTFLSRSPRRLRRFITGLLMAAVFLTLQFSLSAASSMAAAKPYQELSYPPLPEIELPDYQRLTLNNGMVLYLMENHELPLVSGQMRIHTGSRFEPDDKVGLANLTGSLLRAGGTQVQSPAELNQFLEDRAASIETSIGKTSGGASFSALTEDLEPVLRSFAQVLRQPAFDEKKFAFLQAQVAGNLARRNDDPDNITSREFSKLLYGETSPYARTLEPETLGNISRQDIIDFYQDNFFPNRILFGIYGDFDSQATVTLIKELFDDWQPTETSLPQLPDVAAAQQGSTFVVDQPQLNQSNVQLGHLGGLASSPDYPALSVMNGVMNGFGGRLVNEVRSRRGLAYSVYGYWSPNYDYPGTFFTGAQTRTEATVPLIQALREEFGKLRANDISPEELRYAKESALNSFVFNFQNPRQTLSRLMRYEYVGYPADFIFDYQKGVEATTIADVRRVAQKYLRPDELVTLVVGNAEAFSKELKAATGQKIQRIEL